MIGAVVDFFVDNFFALMFYALAGLFTVRYTIGLVRTGTLGSKQRKIETEKKMVEHYRKRIDKLKRKRTAASIGTDLAELDRDIRHCERMLRGHKVKLRELTGDTDTTPVKPYASIKTESREAANARSVGKRNMIDAWRSWAANETTTEREQRIAREKKIADAEAQRLAADRERRVLSIMDRQEIDRDTAEAKIDEIDKKRDYLAREGRMHRTRALGGFSDYDEYAAYMRGGARSSEIAAERARRDAERLIDSPPVSDWTIEQLREWASDALTHRETIVKLHDLNTWERHLDYCCALISDRRDEHFESRTGISSMKHLRHESTDVRDAYLAGGIAGAEHIADAISRSRQLVRTDEQTQHAVDDVARRLDAALAGLRETHTPTEQRADHADWKEQFDGLDRPQIEQPKETD